LTPLMIPVDSAAESADTTAEQSRGGSAESPLEFFVDGPETEVPRINRSPSPIRYARPPSGLAPGNWQAHVSTKGETTDDDLAGASSSASNSRNLAPFKRKRVQLRSYKMDYRPQTQNVTDLPDILVNDSSSRENLLLISTSAAATTMGTVVPSPSRLARRALPHPPKSKRAKMQKKDKCSFGDFPSIVASGSASDPGARNSFPEWKGRSRQPRRLAEAVSLAVLTVGPLNPTCTSFSSDNLERILRRGIWTRGRIEKLTPIIWVDTMNGTSKHLGMLEICLPL